MSDPDGESTSRTWSRSVTDLARTEHQVAGKTWTQMSGLATKQHTRLKATKQGLSYHIGVMSGFDFNFNFDLILI